ncbi:MAG TPA: SDR family oxidoreductase [Nitrosopumilaceae archaeon]|nr:SDR family oxidoreductase [Nitrosopumilaceae archaeon]
MKKKLFIFGIGGLTGSKIAILAKNGFEIYGSYNLRNPKFDFIDGIKLDILDMSKVKDVLSKIKPDVIINTCAINSVDYCENHQEEAKKINIDFVEKLYEITKPLGIKLVHLSSDSVFDGTKKDPYKEDDIPKPINYYGYTKMIGEKLVLENTNNLVVRASVLYGWLPKLLSQISSSSMKPTNFGQWLINKLHSNERIKIVTDEYSSPILADDFARSILHLVNGNYSGIFHSAPMIQISRYDFCVKLAESLGLNSKLIEPVITKELGRNVTTGFNKCLDSSKIINESKFKFLSLDESFRLLKEQIDN